MNAAPRNPAAAGLTAESRDGVVEVVLSGDWSLDNGLPDRQAIYPLLADSKHTSLTFQTRELGRWDSSLVTTLAEIIKLSRNLQPQTEIDTAGLEVNLRALVDLAFAVDVPEDAGRKHPPRSIAYRVGEATLGLAEFCRELVTFIGELVLSLQRLVTGKATIKPANILLEMQQAGAEALPIVGLISFLIGMIFAFVGVMQLSNFGAGIYTADLVAVAQIREMGPIMTAILMAGRTGAAYAAQLGTMRVNEEIDALTTLGINPIDYLVLPRFIALVVMLPVLTIYADVIGILGGAFVGILMLDVTPIQYAVQTESAIGPNNLFGGLFKAFIYGGLVALAGTQQGINCGTSAQAVGEATTRAVVTSIVLIVISASVLTVIYVNLGI